MAGSGGRKGGGEGPSAPPRDAAGTPYPPSPLYPQIPLPNKRRLILPNCGLHHYRADSQYGGGEWVLLTAWLGWHAARRGEWDKAAPRLRLGVHAKAALRWVEAQADAAGQFPEQVPENLNDASHHAPWRERWGEIARPLLWSHAKYLILHKAIHE